VDFLGYPLTLRKEFRVINNIILILIDK